MPLSVNLLTHPLSYLRFICLAYLLLVLVETAQTSLYGPSEPLKIDLSDCFLLIVWICEDWIFYGT